MKRNGIAKTVIIQVIHYRYDNSYLAAVLRQYPQYFLGVCRVDPLDPGRARSPHAMVRTERISRSAPESGRRCERRLDSRAAHGTLMEALRQPESSDDAARADQPHSGLQKLSTSFRI